jgi:hypothetical protein
MRNSVALATFVMAAAAPLAAQGVGTGINDPGGGNRTSVGLSAGTFLEIPVGAREAALAGAAAATTSGLTSLYWNSAAAAELQHVSAALSRSDLYGGSGLTHTYAAVGFPVGGSSIFAVSFTYFTSGDIERTTEQFPEGGDPIGGGLVRWDAYSTGLHYARRLTDRLSVGIAGKYVSEGVDFASANWLAADISTLFRTGLFATTLGASVSNLGGSAKFGGPALERNIPEGRDVFPVSRDVDVTFKMQNVQLPAIVNFAITTEVLGGQSALYPSANGDHALLMNAAVTDADDRAMQPILSAEYRFRNLLHLRMGKRLYTEGDGPNGGMYGFSGGFGLSFPVMERRFTFDYAAWHQTTSELPMTHTFTLQYGY